MANGSPSTIRAGKAEVEITGTTKPLESALDRAKSRLMAVGKVMAVAGGGLLAGGTATLGALTGVFTKFTNHANEISRLATKLGTSTEQLSEFAYAAETTGMSFEDLTGQFENLAERVAQGAVGSGEAAETFKRLGIDAAQLKLQNPIDQMITLADAMQGVTNQTDRLGMLSSLGGDQFQWMENLFAKGPEGIRALMAEAKRVGASVGTEEAQQAQRAGQAIDRAWAAVKNSIMRVGAAILPSLGTIERFSAGIVEAATRFRDFMQENRALVGIIAGVAASLASVGVGLIAVGAMMPAISGAFSLISTVVTAITGGIGFLVAAVPTVFGAIVAIPGLIAGIPAALGAIAAAIPGLIIGAALFAAKLAIVSAAIAGIGYGLYYIATQTDFGRSILEGVLEAGGQVMGYLHDIAQQVKDAVLTIIAPLMDTWGDIKESFASGDMAGAFKLTVAALKVSWAEFMIYFQEGWSRVERWFSETWLEIQFRFEVIWIKIKAAVKQLGEIFAPQIDFVKRLFRGLFDAIYTSLKVVAGLVYLAFIKPLQEMLNLMARAARAIGQSELARSLQDSVKGAIDSVKDFAAEFEKGIELNSKVAVDAKVREHELAKEIDEAERQAALAKRQEERDAANERLTALRAELAAKRLITAELPAENPKIQQAVTAARAFEYSVRGGFDARNAKQMYAGNAAMVAAAEKQLAAQQDANRLLEELLQKVDSIGFVWG